jgi:hypothetical protein
VQIGGRQAQILSQRTIVAPDAKSNALGAVSREPGEACLARAARQVDLTHDPAAEQLGILCLVDDANELVA